MEDNFYDPVQEQKSSRIPNYIWIIIAAVAIAALLAGGGYYILVKSKEIPSPSPTEIPTPMSTPSPSPVSRIEGWETYEDTSFEIQYPSDKQAVIEIEESYVGMCGLGKGEAQIKLYALGYDIPSDESEFSGFLSVAIDRALNPEEISIDEWVENNCGGGWIISASTEKREVTLDGREGLEFTGGERGIGSLVIIPKNGDFYFLYAWDITDPDARDVLNLMYSSFTFRGAPDEIADWETYTSEEFGYLFKYPTDFALYHSDHPDYPTGSFFLQHTDPESLAGYPVAISSTVAFPEGVYPDTNFKTAYVSVAVDPTIANLPDCRKYAAHGDIKEMSEEKEINGITFYTGTNSGAAAGTLSKTRIYHALHEEKCYELNLNLFTGNIASYEPGTVEEIDEYEVWKELEDIASTFGFFIQIY